ncbi:MAG: 2-hydroxyacid dehydrogenase [Pseudomonadota bacterium]
MDAKVPLLLIGRLFGNTTDTLASRFDLVQTPDFSTPPHTLIETANLRALAIGMVGSGHISYQAVTDAFLAQFPRLEMLAALGVGCEFIDMEATEARGIVVTNTPGTNSEETADTAMGLLLCTVRQLPQADRFVRAGDWPDGMFPLTPSLRTKKLGILGLGNIGKAIALRAEPFGVDILYHGRTHQTDMPYRYVDSVHELAALSDILMVVVPGGPDTDAIVDRTVLDALGPAGILINISRGSVVDERELVSALRDARILSAGLDVFEDEPNVPSELIAMEHVVLTPHLGSGTHHTRQIMAQAVVDNMVCWLEGRPVLNRMRAGD